jgi:DNA gyrase subunit B
MEFSFIIFEYRLNELAFLNSNVYIILSDERDIEQKIANIKNSGNIKEFIMYLDKIKNSLIDNSTYFFSTKNNIMVEKFVIEWTNSYHKTLLC